MKATEAIQQIQADIANAKEGGTQQILVANLEVYLATVLEKARAEESAAGAEKIDQANHQLEVWKAQLSASTNHSIEMFKAVIEAGQTALKSAIVINGGAAAALLAFAGNAITKGQVLAGDPLLSQIGIGLALFVTGLGCAGLASGMRYLAQFAYSEFHYNRKRVRMRAAGTVVNWLSITLGAASFGCFFFGGYSTYAAIARPSVHVTSPVALLSSPFYGSCCPVARIAHVYWRSPITCSEYHVG
ncbi:hypothetical protein GO998_05140 [Ralstonia syzygii]|uniref:Uncharacterized protein n=1 Tax=Ralstonia syzygii TaxID=28097 RepID=A0ABX7ZE23_9RALS|nr:hypothetical protein [Ralstonia syzygii]QUP53192.1 hypothetical protein GO998_05140 [Ralstonia syzygii]